MSRAINSSASLSNIRKLAAARLIALSVALFALLFLWAWIADSAIAREDEAVQEAMNCFGNECFGIED